MTKMKNRNIVAIIIAALFVVLPLLSILSLKIWYYSMNSHMSSVVDEIRQNHIRTVEVEGTKTSKNMLYVGDTRIPRYYIKLFTTPKSIDIYGDTLKVEFDDNSNVYQGAIMIDSIRYVIRNGEKSEIKH